MYRDVFGPLLSKKREKRPIDIYNEFHYGRSHPEKTSPE
jgi:hypothetical protein